MCPPSSYSVVGVRADGSRTTLARHVHRDAAEGLLTRAHPQSDYLEYRLLIEGEWPPTVVRRQSRKQREPAGL